MRIKSYFAPSVQTAIALARKEFNDDVTLVTSHAASHDGRHLGEYEVVFAVEESSEEEQPEEITKAAPEPATFQNLLQAAVAAKPSAENLPEKLEQLRSLFIEMGVDRPLVRALMTMVERCIPSGEAISAPAALLEPMPETPVAREPAIPPSVWAKPSLPPQLATLAKAQYTAAELAFVLSVSELPADVAASGPHVNEPHVNERHLKAQTANR